jgi:hydroxypyruvate reductase
VLLLGSNGSSLRAAAAAATRRGYRVLVGEGRLVGEAREAGVDLAQAALAEPPGTCLIWGGETTVTVRGTGRGGRNQEVTAAAAGMLDGVPREIAVLCGGTDGIDGPTDAAGGLVTPRTAALARAAGWEAREALARNDTYAYLGSANALVRTGPTHTNVMDVAVACVA